MAKKKSTGNLSSRGQAQDKSPKVYDPPQGVPSHTVRKRTASAKKAVKKAAKKK